MPGLTTKCSITWRNLSFVCPGRSLDENWPETLPPEDLARRTSDAVSSHRNAANGTLTSCRSQRPPRLQHCTLAGAQSSWPPAYPIPILRLLSTPFLSHMGAKWFVQASGSFLRFIGFGLNLMRGLFLLALLTAFVRGFIPPARRHIPQLVPRTHRCGAVTTRSGVRRAATEKRETTEDPVISFEFIDSINGALVKTMRAAAK